MAGWALGMLSKKEAAYQEALFYFKRCLNIAKYWQSLLWHSFIHDELVQTYVLMGRSDEANLLHIDGLEWHLAIGQVWQTLGYLWARSAFHPETIGGAKTAVTIISMAYHHPDVCLHIPILSTRTSPL